MTSTLNDTPQANRIHIALFGKRNCGKSSLINAFIGQEVAIVSDKPGTTTDPVYKAMEINGLGACTLIDTAGFDDEDDLGKLRIKKTKDIVKKCDIALLLYSGSDLNEEFRWFQFLSSQNIPVINIISKSDMLNKPADLSKLIYEKTNNAPLLISAKEKKGLNELKEKLVALNSAKDSEISITGDLVRENDLVLLVMPQNIQAPKGRLILPQVQTIRELLDKHCIIMNVQTDNLAQALALLNKSPQLIITDSQDFNKVAPLVPEGTKLTSFSILFAAYKGDLTTYLNGTKKIKDLNSSSKILIAECCTHAPLAEDIGREKIPALLRKKISPDIDIQIVSGNDYPENLKDYDLIIQCGGCMFTRRHILNRIKRATEQNVAITNYGLTLAYLQGVPLEKLAVSNK